MKRIKLEPNVPLTIALVDPFADSSEGYDSEMRVCEYRTTDGRVLALPRQAAIDLNSLEVKPDEQITVTRAKTGQHISICLAPQSERARAAEESESPSDEELLLEASLKRENVKQRRNGRPTPIRKEPAPASTPAQPRLFDRGTGTDGPAPQRAILPAVARNRTPYPDMLRHIVRTVKGVLSEEKLHLGDGPTQDLISTVYIDAAKRSGVEYDFTGEGQ
jgi:hypothetical protein